MSSQIKDIVDAVCTLMCMAVLCLPPILYAWRGRGR